VHFEDRLSSTIVGEAFDNSDRELNENSRSASRHDIAEFHTLLHPVPQPTSPIRNLTQQQKDDMASSEIEVPLPPLSDLPSSTPSNLPPRKPLAAPLTAAMVALPSQTDVFLTRLNKALATPSGVDTVMLFLCYTSRFSSSLLTSLAGTILRRSARDWLALVASLPRGTTLLFSAPSSDAAKTVAAARALILARRLKAFSDLLSEARTILRLWALLGMYFWGKGLVCKAIARWRGQVQEKNKESLGETAIAWTRLGLCVGLQALENGAYLSQRGVLGWSPKQIGLAYKWSARFWAAYIGVELGRLLAEGFGGNAAQKAGDKETVEWRKKVVRNMAWMPLTIHWSMDKGFVSEPFIGLLASVPGIIQIRDLWAETA